MKKRSLRNCSAITNYLSKVMPSLSTDTHLTQLEQRAHRINQHGCRARASGWCLCAVANGRSDPMRSESNFRSLDLLAGGGQENTMKCAAAGQ